MAVSAAEQARREQQLKALLEHLTKKSGLDARYGVPAMISQALAGGAYKSWEDAKFQQEFRTLARNGVEWTVFGQLPAKAQDIPRDTPPALAEALREAIRQRPQMERAGKQLDAQLVTARDKATAGPEREALEALRKSVETSFNSAILFSDNPAKQARTEAVRALKPEQLRAIKPDSITDTQLREAVVERTKAEAQAAKLKGNGADGLMSTIVTSLKAAKIPEDRARAIATEAMRQFNPPTVSGIEAESFATRAEVARAREAVFKAVGAAVKEERGLEVAKVTDPGLRAAVLGARGVRTGETGPRPHGADVAGVVTAEPGVPMRKPGQSAYPWRPADRYLDEAVDGFRRTRAAYDRAETNTVGHMPGFESYYIPDRTPPGRPPAGERRGPRRES